MGNESGSRFDTTRLLIGLGLFATTLALDAVMYSYADEVPEEMRTMYYLLMGFVFAAGAGAATITALSKSEPVHVPTPKRKRRTTTTEDDPTERILPYD